MIVEARVCREERQLRRGATVARAVRGIGGDVERFLPLLVIEREEQRLRRAEGGLVGPQQRNGLEEALAGRVGDLELCEGFVAVLVSAEMQVDRVPK